MVGEGVRVYFGDSDTLIFYFNVTLLIYLIFINGECFVHVKCDVISF